jgi:hypothetical protein
MTMDRASDLNPALGLIVGALLGLAFWAAIAVVVVFAMGGI